jgi:hypothetical protein
MPQQDSVPIQSQSFNSRLQAQDYQFSMQTSRVVTPSPVSTNNYQFQSFGQAAPPQLPSVQAHPTIQPFNNAPSSSSVNDYNFEGSFASIGNSQLSRGRELRELLNGDP